MWSIPLTKLNGTACCSVEEYACVHRSYKWSEGLQKSPKNLTCFPFQMLQAHEKLFELNLSKHTENAFNASRHNRGENDIEQH